MFKNLLQHFRYRLHWSLVFGFSLFLGVPTEAAAQQSQVPRPLVPMEAFFEQVEVGAMALSPSGRWLSSTVKSPEGRLRLHITDLQDKEPVRVVAGFSKHDVVGVRWVSDDWLVFSTSDRVTFRNQRGSGLFSVSRNGERLRQIIKRSFDTEYGAVGGALEGNHEYLAMGRAGTNEVIVGEYLFNGDRVTVNPISVDVGTGARRRLVENPPRFASTWTFDSEGRARAAMSFEDGQVSVHWFDESSKGWKQIDRFSQISSRYSLFSMDRDQLLVSHNDESGFGTISRLDTQTGKIVGDPIITTPGFSDNISRVNSRQSNGALVGMDVLTDAYSRIWLDPAMRSLQEKVDQLLSGRVNTVLGCGPCNAESPVLVSSFSDRDPGLYLLYRPQTGKLERLSAVRPSIDPARMTPMELLRVKARDGADLPYWITRPPAAKALPAVVLVHGGPWARGQSWRWDAEAQFLASRGYVVIEPEFRASTGYGYKHFRAGWKQWGQSMQDDVSDALAHAVSQGWVDPKRVCIAGASYGGYATLMGLAKTPEQYRCGVSWVGVTDQKLLFSVHWSDTSEELKKYSMKAMVGDPQADSAMLDENSPLKRAAQIKAPVLLAYGRVDRRVPLVHGESMREALIKAGNAPDWVVYDEEGHNWRLPATTMDFFKRVEAFLRKHNPPNN